MTSLSVFNGFAFRGSAQDDALGDAARGEAQGKAGKECDFKSSHFDLISGALASDAESESRLTLDLER